MLIALYFARFAIFCSFVPSSLSKRRNFCIGLCIVLIESNCFSRFSSACSSGDFQLVFPNRARFWWNFAWTVQTLADSSFYATSNRSRRRNSNNKNKDSTINGRMNAICFHRQGLVLVWVPTRARKEKLQLHHHHHPMKQLALSTIIIIFTLWTSMVRCIHVTNMVYPSKVLNPLILTTISIIMILQWVPGLKEGC
jgi:hypothetical protein